MCGGAEGSRESRERGNADRVCDSFTLHDEGGRLLLQATAAAAAQHDGEYDGRRAKVCVGVCGRCGDQLLSLAYAMSSKAKPVSFEIRRSASP